MKEITKETALNLIAIFLIGCISFPSFGFQNSKTGAVYENADESGLNSKENLDAKINQQKKKEIPNTAKNFEDKSKQPQTLEQALTGRIVKAEDTLTKISTGWLYCAGGFPKVTGDLKVVYETLSAGRGFGHLVMILFYVIFVYGAGFGVEYAVRKVTAPIRLKLETRSTDNLFKSIINNLLLLLLGIAYFGVFLYFLIYFIPLSFPEESHQRMLAAGYLIPITQARIAILFFQFLFSPYSKASRFTPLSDYAAKQLYTWLSLVVIVSPVFARTILHLYQLGISHQVHTFLLGLEVWIPASMLWYLIIHNKRPMAEYIRTNSTHFEKGGFNYWFAKKWHILASLYILLMVALRQINLFLGKEQIWTVVYSLISLPTVIFLDQISWSALKAALAQKQENDEDSATRSNESIHQVHNVLRFLLAAGFFFWLLKMWGMEIGLFKVFIRAVAVTFIAVLISYFLWEYIKRVIDSRLKEESMQDDEEIEEMGKGGSRTVTLLALLRKFIFITIAAITILAVLSSLGVDIGPLLAGAGILGLAIGFGAQTLVRDMLSGLFFLLDDAFRIGDYVESGSYSGSVEHISLRSMRIRGARGMIYTVPYGSLGAITNFSRDWTVVKFDIRVPYDTDIDNVRKVVKKIYKKIATDEELGPKLIDKIKLQGVKEIDDSAIVLRIKYKTRPGDQFAIKRKLYKDIQIAFAEKGIEFAPRKVIVQIPETLADSKGELTSEQKIKHIGAAAAETVLESPKQ